VGRVEPGSYLSRGNAVVTDTKFAWCLEGQTTLYIAGKENHTRTLYYILQGVLKDAMLNFIMQWLTDNPVKTVSETDGRTLRTTTSVGGPGATVSFSVIYPIRLKYTDPDGKKIKWIKLITFIYKDLNNRIQKMSGNPIVRQVSEDSYPDVSSAESAAWDDAEKEQAKVPTRYGPTKLNYEDGMIIMEPPVESGFIFEWEVIDTDNTKSVGKRGSGLNEAEIFDVRNEKTYDHKKVDVLVYDEKSMVRIEETTNEE
jgi:hypothetical protein